MSTSLDILCGRTGCRTRVTGIYCLQHRAEYQEQQAEASRLRSERMKSLWAESREEMLAKIAAGKMAAQEGK